MKPSRPSLWFCALLAAGFTLGCSDATQFGGKKEKRDESSSTEEEQEIDDPEQVAGSFLCGFDDTRPSTASATPIGCGIYDEEARKVMDERLHYDLELVDETDQAVPMQTETAPAESQWIVLAQLPNDYKQTGKLKMFALPLGAMDSPKSGTLGTDVDNNPDTLVYGTMPTADIGKALPFGPDLALKELTFDAYWEPGSKDAWRFGIDTNDFCLPSGLIRTSLQETSISVVNAAKEITGVTISTKIYKKALTMSVDNEHCMQDFDIGKFGKQYGRYAVGAGKCLFARINDKLYISMEKVGPLYTLENLAAFTNHKACK